MNLFLIYPILTVAFIAIHMASSRQARTAEGASRAVLTWAIFFNVGVAGIMAAYAHAFRPEATAAYIGWAPGGPFQYEVACANFAFGAMGILCLFFSSMFRLATIVGQGVFLLGAAYGHLQQIQVAQNMAPGNAGPALSFDVAVPPVLLVLWILHRVMRDRARRAKEISQAQAAAQAGQEPERRAWNAGLPTE